MEYFQDDLFPDTRVWWEPALASDQWFAGKNGAQKRLSLRPADMKPCKLYVISKPCLDKMNIIKLRVNGLTGFPLMHTCDFTHKNLKGHMLLMSPRVSGMHKDWYYSCIFATILEIPMCFINLPYCLLREYVHPENTM